MVVESFRESRAWEVNPGGSVERGTERDDSSTKLGTPGHSPGVTRLGVGHLQYRLCRRRLTKPVNEHGAGEPWADEHALALLVITLLPRY